MEHKFIKSLNFGNFKLKNRIAMASMTRCRADYFTGNIKPEMVLYYKQRAESASLIFTECLFIDSKQNSYLGAGGIQTEEHVRGWKEITDVVHKENSFIFAQIYHPGRVLHPETTGTFPIGPSPIKAEGQCYVKGIKKDYVVPNEMTINDIENCKKQFLDAALCAKRAGFDGIEIHAANGYLIDQFLRSSSNTRQDKYGGSFENRCRFLIEIIEKINQVFPIDQIGIKLSLVGRFNSMKDCAPIELGKYLLETLSKKNILYVQLMEAEPISYFPINNGSEQILNCAKTFRKYFKNFLITNGFQEINEGLRRLEEEEADIISFGTLFISNPDLVDRIKNNYEIVLPEQKYFYSPGSEGFTDYKKYSKK